VDGWGNCPDCDAIAEVAHPLGGSLNRLATTSALTALSSWTNANRITARLLNKFTHSGSGVLVYTGAAARRFIIRGIISMRGTGALGTAVVDMGLFVNGVPSFSGTVGYRSSVVINSTTGDSLIMAYTEARALNPNDTVELGFASPSFGTLSDYMSLSIQ
jgi:hypothetical protein